MDSICSILVARLEVGERSSGMPLQQDGRKNFLVVY